MQDLLTTFLAVTCILEDAGISYMVVGSVAAMTYGEPRMTHDLDLVVQISPKDASKLGQIFPEDDCYCPPEDVIIKKLEYFREGGSQKHIQDIQGILAQTPLDEAYLQYWISDLSLQKQWKEI